MNRSAAALYVTVCTAVHAQPTDWHRAQMNNRMDNESGVALIATSSESYPSSFRSAKPSIVIRCSAKKAELFLNAGTQLQPEHSDGWGRRTIRVKLDEGKPVKIAGSESTSGDAVFISAAGEWIRKLSAAKLALIEVTPFRHAPATVGFNIAGLSAFKDDIQKYCGVTLADSQGSRAKK